MWQFKNTIPKPAKINLNGKPSVQVGGTTWEYWCETLPPTIDPSDWEEELRPKMKLDEDFQRPISSVVTDFSSHLAIHSAISTVVGILSASENVADNSGVYPARLDTYACEYCDFWRLCSAPLKYGGDASDIIEMEYRSKIR
jgi:hypothetical protein